MLRREHKAGFQRRHPACMHRNGSTWEPNVIDLGIAPGPDNCSNAKLRVDYKMASFEFAF